MIYDAYLIPMGYSNQYYMIFICIGTPSLVSEQALRVFLFFYFGRGATCLCPKRSAFDEGNIVQRTSIILLISENTE